MAAMDLVDDISRTGQLVGAINVARRESDGRWLGDMFDGRGCVRGLKDQGDDPEGKSHPVEGICTQAQFPAVGHAAPPRAKVFAAPGLEGVIGATS